jgi:hypothetical protein
VRCQLVKSFMSLSEFFNVYVFASILIINYLIVFTLYRFKD